MSTRFIVASILTVSLFVATRPGASQVREASIEQRSISLDGELRRLRLLEASLGEKHPKRKELMRRIAQVQDELGQLQPSSNPFEIDRQANRTLVEQMSDAELRTAVIRLATDVKQLQERVAKLESQNHR